MVSGEYLYSRGLVCDSILRELDRIRRKLSVGQHEIPVVGLLTEHHEIAALVHVSKQASIAQHQSGLRKISVYVYDYRVESREVSAAFAAGRAGVAVFDALNVFQLQF